MIVLQKLPLLFDGHCDAPWAKVENGRDVLSNRPVIGPYIQVVNTFLSDSMLQGSRQWTYLFSMWNYSMKLSKTMDLPIITKTIGQEQSGIILGLEGLDFFSGNLYELDLLYQLGYRLFAITWNRKNLLADGISAGKSAKGLTMLGKHVVKWCYDKNVILDLAHLAEPGFWDIVEIYEMPLVVSHANCFKCCPHPRNLSDNQIKALISCNGLIGLTFVPEFLIEDANASLEDIIRHIDHVLSLGGIENIGFGSDFGGTEKLPEGIKGPESWGKIIDLLYKNYSDEIVHKILGLNWLKVVNSIFS